MIEFNSCDFPTVGVEEEFHLIDPVTADMACVAPQMMAILEGEIKERVTYELFDCNIENRSGIFRKLEDLEQYIIKGRKDLCIPCEKLNVKLAACGTHPFAEWRNLPFVQSEHYQWVKENYAGPVKRLLALGMHVHVGVKNWEVALYVMQQMKRWTYPLLALSCNSPYFRGIDYGMQSVRTNIFHALPRTNFAPEFENSSELEYSYRKLYETGDVRQYTHCWWIIRPQPKFGTVEYRMFDMATDVKRIAALAALVQAATAFYQDQYLLGATRSQYNQLFLEQNEWNVSRDGLGAVLIDPESGEKISCQEQIDKMVDLVTPTAKELGSEIFLKRIKKIQKEGTEADWQRKFLAECNGDLKALELEIARRTCLY